MKKLVLVLALAMSSSVAAQSADDVQKANALIDEGVREFKQKNYSSALSRFEQAYELVPSAATAALAAQAKANADADHPTGAVEWLKRGNSVAATRPPDASGWTAFGRAFDALARSTTQLEEQVIALKKQRVTFDARFRLLDSQIKSLSAELNAAKRMMPATEQRRVEMHLQAAETARQAATME